MSSMTKCAWAGAAVALFASGAAWANDGPPCREHKLNGLYVFTASGYTNSGATPKAIVELLRFNGDGTLTVTGGTVSMGGNIVTIQPGASTGTYTLDEDCRGTLVFLPSGPSFNIFATPRREDLWMIQTNPGNIFQGNVTQNGALTAHESRTRGSATPKNLLAVQSQRALHAPWSTIGGGSLVHSCCPISAPPVDADRRGSSTEPRIPSNFRPVPLVSRRNAVLEIRGLLDRHGERIACRKRRRRRLLRLSASHHCPGGTAARQGAIGRPRHWRFVTRLQTRMQATADKFRHRSGGRASTICGSSWSRLCATIRRLRSCAGSAPMAGSG